MAPARAAGDTDQVIAHLPGLRLDTSQRTATFKVKTVTITDPRDSTHYAFAEANGATKAADPTYAADATDRRWPAYTLKQNSTQRTGNSNALSSRVSISFPAISKIAETAHLSLTLLLELVLSVERAEAVTYMSISRIQHAGFRRAGNSNRLFNE